MATSAFRKKQEHKMKVKLRKMNGGLVKAVDRVDAMIDSNIAQTRNQ